MDAREEEIAEVYASDGIDIRTAILKSIDKSTEVHTILDGDRATAIFGLRPLDLANGIACPWMLTTNEMKKHPRTLIRVTKPIVNIWNSEWNILLNYVDDRYEASLRWAKWAGFEVFPPQEYGFLKLPFRRIERRKNG